MKKTSLKIVVVQWEDALSYDPGWTPILTTIQAAEAEGAQLMVSTGILLQKNRRYFLLTSLVDPAAGRHGPILKIPKRSIVAYFFVDDLLKRLAGPKRKR